MELCIEAQADGGAGGTNATCDTRMFFQFNTSIVYQYQYLVLFLQEENKEIYARKASEN